MPNIGFAKKVICEERQKAKGKRQKAKGKRQKARVVNLINHCP